MKEPTMTEIERKAEKILDDVWKCYISVQNGLEKLKPLLSTNSRPPAGFVRDAEGVDRRVLGNLLLTADGCIVGDKGKVYRVSDNYRDGIGLYPAFTHIETGDFDRPEMFADPIEGAALVKTLQSAADAIWCGTCNAPWHAHMKGKDCRCYSTREAAEAAAGKERGE